jgi:hypothetical protein
LAVPAFPINTARFSLRTISNNWEFKERIKRISFPRAPSNGRGEGSLIAERVSDIGWTLASLRERRNVEPGSKSIGSYFAYRALRELITYLL